MLHRIQTPSAMELTDRAQPVVVTVSDIDEETSKVAADVARAHATGQMFLPVIVDSYGGDTYAFMAVWSILDAAAFPVVPVVTSKAMSCGLGLFAAGQVRIASPFATLLLHNVSTPDSGDRRIRRGEGGRP
jgi:ATP-dependent protease ClpP protease subunit